MSKFDLSRLLIRFFSLGKFPETYTQCWNSSLYLIIGPFPPIRPTSELKTEEGYRADICISLDRYLTHVGYRGCS